MEREHPVAIDNICDWNRFQPRDVHKCNRSLLDSNKEGILSIVLLELFRITRITLHCPFHEYRFRIVTEWVVDVILLQVGLKCLSMRMTLDLLHTSSRTRKFSACCATACGNPDTLKSMSISSRCVNKPMDCSLSTCLPVHAR